MADRDLPSVLALAEQLRPAIVRNDRARLNGIIEQLVELDAPMGAQWQQLAHIALGNGELTLARKAMDLHGAGLGHGPAVEFQKAGFLAMLGAWPEVDALLRTLPPTVPDPATNAYVRGIAALNLGNSEKAFQHLDQATKMRPTSGHAWYSFALATNFSLYPGLADRLVAAGPVLENAPLQERIPYQYALGKAYADRGAHGEAFAAFARGAAMAMTTATYDPETDRDEALRSIAGYDAARITALARRQTEPTCRTIFVAGLPRSGTTLVEQVLTSHSAVSDGGEIARLFLLANEVGGASYDALAEYVEDNGAAPAARLWHHWLDELFPAAGRIVDKTVTTSRFLGLAAALLPDAPLVWMTRDPLDRAWSCFRTNFAGSAMSWSYDLEHIAAHFRVEDELLARWREILGERLLVLSYEDLVTDPGTWIPRLIAHCGLAEEAQVFSPHKNRRPVTTSSMMQVRRPINRDAIGAAEPYRKFLQPFLDAYYA